MRMYSKDGIEMMFVSSLSKEGKNLVVRGKMMRTMPATIYLRPDELVKGLGLLSWRVVMCMPVMLLRGLYQTIKNRLKKDSKS